MKISEDHRFFNEIVNHPRVLPSVSQYGPKELDLEPIWDWCVGIEFDTGGWIFQQLEGGYYEVHTLFLPKSRDIVPKAKQALHHMFTRTDMLECVTRVPRDLPHALKLAQAGGFRWRFAREDGWHRQAGPIPCDYLGLTIDEWTRGSDELMARGVRFHHQLGEHQNHADDPVNDAYAGLGLECWEGGQLKKGLWRYNRWAIASGYRPLHLSSENTIEFDGVALRMVNGKVELEEVLCP